MDEKRMTTRPGAAALFSRTTTVEGAYAMRLYVASGLAAMVAVPALKVFYRISVEQAAATALVPLLLAYLTLRITAEFVEPPSTKLRAYSWFCMAITGFLTLGIGFVLLAIGIAVSFPLYQAVNIDWVSGRDIFVASPAAFLLGAMFVAVAGKLRHVATKRMSQSSNHVPTLIEMARNVITIVDSDTAAAA
jgi:hypothetical protein